MHLATLQREHRDWVEVMFPGQEPWVPAMNLIEEVGELTRPILKTLCLKRWGDEPRYADKDWRPELVDAVGDVAISLCSVANAMGVELTTDVNYCPPPPVSILDALSDLVADCSSIFSRAARNQKAQHKISMAMRSLMTLASWMQMDFDECVDVTWNRVKRRRR